MTDVVQGTYRHWKHLKTRDEMVIEIHFPIEQAENVHALLGYPKMGEDIWVAVARLRGAE